MNQSGTSVGADGHVGQEEAARSRAGDASELSEPLTQSPARRERLRVALLVAGTIVGLLGLAMLAGGGWALWKDRVDRDDGFVSIGTTELHTDSYAIISDLKGDGPSWIYGSTVLGDARVRATSLSDHPIFIGIAPSGHVARYLDGVGHGTIEHLATGELSTTNAGGAPSSPPAQALTWTASTAGTGEQTLLWEPRDGDWSIVLMNVDASAGVDIEGDLGAEFPPLPWLAGGLLVVGAVFALLAAWLLVRGIRGQTVSNAAG